MDHNVSTAARLIDNETDAINEAHFRKMKDIYDTLDHIAAERYRLTKLEVHLRSQIVEALGVAVGDILERRGVRWKVLSVEGVFHDPLLDNVDYPTVICHCTQELTRGGFAKRRTKGVNLYEIDLECPINRASRKK